MKNKLIVILALLMAVLCLMAGCATNETTDTTDTAATSTEQAERSVIYEAIFLDNDEITNLFVSMRGETAPFDNVTKDFHVTTEYMPAESHSEWYGEKITVHITAYAVQDITADDGQTTSNEGFKAEVTSENAELNAYLESLNKNFHITGAYKDAAKYTEYVDFSQGEAVDFTVTGTFGGYYSDGVIELGE